MSQRSQVANSGSRPIAACSAACAAPGTSAHSSPTVASRSGHTEYHTARVRSWRGGRSSGSSPSTSPLPRRLRRKDTTCEVTSTTPKCSSTFGQWRPRSESTTRISVTSRAEVE